jgi:hypothetical protein
MRLGVPYSEPAFAGLQPLVGECQPVHGVAYKIFNKDFVRIIATEGGGVAYTTLTANAVFIGK